MAPDPKKIAIVGAGIAGLCTAKTLKSFGHAVTVFEKEVDVGGVWSASRRYPGLTTQNPKETYDFSDFPMPDDYPEWPSGEQMQDYLESYVRHFDLTENLVLGTSVSRAELKEGGESWQVETAGEVSQQFTFDYLIVCNGIFSIPSVPQYAGEEAYKAAGGRILHTSEFTRLEDARNKNVLVVGYGKSSCDAANAIAGVSKSTTLIARHLIWKIPKKLKKLNMKFLFLTRMGEGLFRYIRVSGFEKFLHGKGKRIRDAMMNSVEGVIEKQLRLSALGLHPEKPLETIARSTVSLVTDGFYEKIESGVLTMKKGVEIVELADGSAKLSDGESLPADLIVCGTGWSQEVPFLNRETVEKLTDDKGNFRLYRTMLPINIPRLLFNGYNSSFFSQLNAEVGALWLVEYISGNIAVPSESEMRKLIDERLAWTEARTDGKHSRGTNIIPFSVHQMDEILNEISLNLSPWKRFTQWLLPVRGSDYKHLPKQLQRRHVLGEKAGTQRSQARTSASAAG